MKLSELIDYIGTDLLDDRAELLEGPSDSIWSDVSIIRQLNDAQRVLCRRAWVLEDTDLASADSDGNLVCRIQLVEDQSDYAFHKSILKIKRARLSDSEIDLPQVEYNDNHLRLNSIAADPDFWDVNNPLTENSGRPIQFSADIGTRILKLRRKPDATAALLTLDLVVVRMPIIKLSVKDMNAEPEVPEEYHELIARAAAGRLLQHPTVDSRAQAIGKDYLQEFDTECKRAEEDRLRRQMVAPRMRPGGWVA